MNYKDSLTHMEVEIEAEELRRQLTSLKRKLIKMRVFHRALTPIERGILYLSSSPGIKLSSNLLQNILREILAKASMWLNPSFVSRILIIGSKKVVSNVRTAIMMGNHEAVKWADEKNYVILMGIHALDSRTSPWGNG